MTFNRGLRTSLRTDAETPQALFDSLDAEFGFTLDAAAIVENAKCERFWTERDNALEQRWLGHVFCNPPYGKAVAAFVEKGWREAQRGAVVVMLVPARTDTRWWHRWVMRAAEIRLIQGRLYFELNGQAIGRAPFPSAIVVFRQGGHVPTVSSYALVTDPDQVEVCL